jgi:hypothetical protein
MQYTIDLKDARKRVSKRPARVKRKALPMPLSDEQIRWGLANQPRWLFEMVPDDVKPV